jgi:carbon storage regulator CsrA
MSKLILSRKDGQTIVIDDSVTITVYSPHRVKVAIEAPDDVRILRGEVAERDQEEARSAG